MGKKGSQRNYSESRERSGGVTEEETDSGGNKFRRQREGVSSSNLENRDAEAAIHRD